VFVGTNVFVAVGVGVLVAVSVGVDVGVSEMVETKRLLSVSKMIAVAVRSGVVEGITSGVTVGSVEPPSDVAVGTGSSNIESTVMRGSSVIPWSEKTSPMMDRLKYFMP
jgi:hypothetical protein